MITTKEPTGVLRTVKWTWSQYQQYLQSIDWAILRAAALRMWGNGCQVCGGYHKHLHHLLYRQFPQDSIPEDLMPVCQDCHRSIHEHFKVPMEREVVIRFFRKKRGKQLVIDKEYRKQQSKIAKQRRDDQERRKQARIIPRKNRIKAGRKAARSFEKKWAWLIRRHPELYGKK